MQGEEIFFMELTVYSVLLNRFHMLLSSGVDLMEGVNKSLSGLDISVLWDMMPCRLLDKC